MNLGQLQSALQHPRYLSPVSAWVEHIPFAFALVDLLRPRTFVELGTHMGDSYCAFCQAVEASRLDTACTAIDTWTGDPQAGVYGSGILDALHRYHDPLYARFSRLLQSTFDDAVGQFPERSIDLLHIDGLHTYEAVRHDFEMWLPMLSARGVVLFHDTQVRRGDFGVYRLWDELASRYPSFEFRHGYGLGVLGAGDDLPVAFHSFLQDAHSDPELTRRFFAVLGNRIQLARGFHRLSDIEAARKDFLTEMIAPFEKPPPAPANALADTVDFLDGAHFDLKGWIDGRCEAAAGRSMILAHLREHLRWLHGEKDALVGRVAALEAAAAPAEIAVYTCDEQGQFNDARLRSFPLAPDTQFATLRVPVSLPAGSANCRIRIDPGDRPAFFVLRRPRIQFLGGGSDSLALTTAQIVPGPGTHLLGSSADLDTPAGGNYVFFCHTGDPQFELRIGPLLPAGPAAFDLLLECRLLDAFRAYRGASHESLVADESVADLLAASLVRTAVSPAPAG